MPSNSVRYDPAMRLRCALGVTAVLCVVTTPAVAEIYKWIDDGGGAHYSEGLESVPEGNRARALPLGFRNQPPPPPSLALPAPRESAARHTSSGRATEIRYVPGERILVDALISPRALVAAGVSLTRDAISGSIQGVTGTAEVKAVVVDSLEIGDARVGRLRVLAYEMGQSGHDGLLGRDYLDQFQLAIDTSRGVVTLSPKR
jgi:Aspartyl protease/Domain of unknown function (DUF4124)